MAEDETTLGGSTSAIKADGGKRSDGRYGSVDVWRKLLNHLRGTAAIRKCWEQLRFFGCSSERRRDIYRKEYWVDITDCCMIWNWGFRCSNICYAWHVCSHMLCRTVFDDDHRATQHAPTPLCADHIFRLQGMNVLCPDPPKYPENSSVEDTYEACQLYNVKPPSLNADLFETLLEKTDLPADLQASLVRG